MFNSKYWYLSYFQLPKSTQDISSPILQSVEELNWISFWFQEWLSAVICIVKWNTTFQNPKLCSDCNFLFKAHSCIFISICPVPIAYIELWYSVQQTKCPLSKISTISILPKEKLQTSLRVQLYIFSFTQVALVDFSGTPHRIKNVMTWKLQVTMMSAHLKCRLWIWHIFQTAF